MVPRALRCLVCVLLLAATAHADTWLLAVGIDQYDDPTISPLHFASADARAMVDCFRQAGLPENRCLLLTSDATDRLSLPTKRNLLAALGRVRDLARPDDSFVFLFSGHGTQEQAQSYLWPMDADRETVGDTALSMALLNEKLRGLKAAQVLYLIDACRNDPKAGRGDADARLDEGFAKGLRPVIVRAGAPPKAALLLACRVGQRAWEMPNEGHGLFSYFILSGLRGEAKADDGTVRLGTLAAYVQRTVPAWAREHGQAQEPLLDNPEGLDFALLRPAVVRELARSATLTVTSEPAGARVTVDGQVVGPTPYVAQYALPGGEPRTVTVEVSLAGHLPQARQVELRPGASPRLELTLLKGAQAAGRTYVVAPQGGDFTTLVEAVAQAEPGSTIKVRPGRYRGRVVVNQPLVILGDGERDAIELSGENGALSLNAATARVAGLTLVGDNEQIVVAEVLSGSPQVDDCVFATRKPTNVVHIQHVNTSPTFRRCSFRGAGDSALHPPVVIVTDHARPTFEGCEFTHGPYGLGVTSGAQAVVRKGRLLANLSAAAWIAKGSTAVFEHCLLSGNQGGNWRIEDGADVTRTNCEEQ